jgi:hypothetical protein
MAIKMARAAKEVRLFVIINFLPCLTVTKPPCYGQLKNKAEPDYCLLLWFNLVCIVWAPADGNGCRFGYHCRLQASN